MADLTDTARVKRMLGIPAAITQHDLFIDDIVASVDEEVLGYIGQAAITVTTHNESYDIEDQGIRELRLRQFPVVSVAAVTDDGALLSSTAYYTDLKPGYIRLTATGGQFTEGVQMIDVTYTAGVPTARLGSVKHAATIICVEHFNRSGHAGFDSEQMASYRYKRSELWLSPEVKRILSRYKNVWSTAP